MKIKAKTQYAIAILSKLDPYAFIKGETLCKELNISHDFAQQILSKLRKADIVTVQRGPSGGYSVNPAIERLTLLELSRGLGEKPTKNVLRDKHSESAHLVDLVDQSLQSRLEKVDVYVREV